MKNRDDGWLVFLLAFLIFTMMFEDDEPQKVIVVEVEPEITEVIPDPHYEINYEIEYGTVYTGNQSPVITRGTFVLDGQFRPGSNGLPANGFAPSHLAIDFQPWKGAEYTLHVPTCCPEPASIVTSNGLHNITPMLAIVEQQNGQLLVKARPLT